MTKIDSIETTCGGKLTCENMFTVMLCARLDWKGNTEIRKVNYIILIEFSDRRFDL